MPRRVLVAGIGNIFLGDDGFGVEVVQRLSGRKLPEGVEVVDFGIRGMDLAYALQEGYDLVVFVDATQRGGEPGTVYLIEPEIEEDGAVSLDTHGMNPVKVIKLSRALGASPTRTLVVGCEPQVIPGRGGGSQTHPGSQPNPYDDMLMELSEPVRTAVEEAAKLVESLVSEDSTHKGSGKSAGSFTKREVKS
jgi:hydrogenase maturation protease